MDQQNQNHGRDQNIINQPGTVTIQQTKLKRSRSESILLKEVADEVTSRLSQSLHNAVLINLDKQIQPQQVRNLLSAEIKIGALPSQPLPPGTEILKVFERSDISGRLLILGDPGCGEDDDAAGFGEGIGGESDRRFCGSDSSDFCAVGVERPKTGDERLADCRTQVKVWGAN